MYSKSELILWHLMRLYHLGVKFSEEAIMAGVDALDFQQSVDAYNYELLLRGLMQVEPPGPGDPPPPPDVRNIIFTGDPANDTTLTATMGAVAEMELTGNPANESTLFATIGDDATAPEPGAFAGFDSAGLIKLDDATLQVFDRDLSGGAHTHTWNGGEIAKATTAFRGDTAKDTALNAQIDNLLIEGRGHTCNTGFADQRQMHATAMFVLARNTARIWTARSGADQTKMDETMKAVLVSTVWTHSDSNPHILLSETEFNFEGAQAARSFNPNWQGGIFHNMLMALIYFGPSSALTTLSTHDHQAYIDSLLASGLEPIHTTFTKYLTNSNAPDPDSVDLVANIGSSLEWHTISLLNPFDMYIRFVNEELVTKNINTGLENGNGKLGTTLLGGYMVNTGDPGRLGLPDIGVEGMFHEFNTVDASGPRSAALYCWDGLITSLSAQYVLCALGYWDTAYTANTVTALNKLEYAVRDWEYKNDLSLGGGYRDFRHGNGWATYSFPATGNKSNNGHLIYMELFAILMQWHEDHGYTRLFPASPILGGIDTSPP